MRILVLNWRDPKNPDAGGAEVHIHEIMRRVAAMGHDVVQVSCAIKGLPEEEVLDGIRILRHGGKYTYNLSLKKFCSNLDVNFDLIIEDLCKLPFFSPGWNMAPVLVVVPHLFGTTAYREVFFPLALYVNILESFIPRVYMNCPFVAISDSTKRDLIRRGIPGEQVKVVECGIDIGHYNPSVDVKENPGTILYVGRIKKYKGINILIDALDLLRKRGRNYRLIIQGTGDYTNSLKQQAKKLGLTSVVDFEGFVSEKQKLYRLRSSTVAAFPSEKEGWGLTVIEANACGAPVVASDSDGLRDSLRNGETGFLVPHGNIEALANRLEEIIENSSLRLKLSKNALNWAKKFSWDATAVKMKSIMEKVSEKQSI